MANKKLIDPEEIKKALAILKPDGELFEVRLLESNGKGNYSGYFTDPEFMIRQLNELQELKKYNAYISLNRIKRECYSRDQKDRFVKNVKTQTSDTDIEGYTYLFVDVDPKRPAGVSSTNEQLEKAKETGNRIYWYLKNLGFNEPVTAMSGNGVHLLYPIRLANTSDNKILVQKCLAVLDVLFSNSDVDIDTANFNPARICKLYGTLAHKGSDTEEAPHRMSMIKTASVYSVTDKTYLQKLSSVLPKEEKPQKYNNYSPRTFDLEQWLDKYGIRYERSAYKDGIKYILQECPFDSNHKGKDACIFQSRSGAIGFHCFHNSCSGKTWQDVRMLYEPDAYERRSQEYERKLYGRFENHEPAEIEPKEGKPVFLTASDILNLKVPDEVFVRTGITEIDRKLRGLKKGYVSVMSGLRAAGKSSIISGMVLDCVNSGNNVAVFSGELTPKNFMRWMNLQAAGKGRTEPTQYEDYYNVPERYQKEIAEWLGEHFWLYNNEYGNEFVSVSDQFEKKIVENNLDLLILDNLMAFNISRLDEKKYDAQTAFVLELQRLAKTYNVHIVFVAHPRKALGFLRLDDISGTADLANAVDNAFIVHRVNDDFKRLSKMMFGWKDDNEIYRASNVIEIAKDRDGGTMDYFVPLHYEKETKRLKNTVSENKIYGWVKDFLPGLSNDDFNPVYEDDDIPFD